MRLCLVVVFCVLAVAVTVEAGYYDKIIKYINSGNFNWKAGHNHVTKMGPEASVLMGSRRSASDSRTLRVKPRVSRTTIPKAFDARENWSSCPSIWSIKDQGDCGTCWAVSTASVMSDRICIASSGAVQVNISAENLAACCTDCGVGCDGGYPDHAWPYFITTGLVTGGDYDSNEGCQPYAVPPSGSPTDQYLVCQRNKCTNTDYTKKYKKDLHYGETAYFLPDNVEAIQAEIMTNGPVAAAFTVYEDFMTYSSGVYQHVTGAELGGHGVRILGWGVEDGVDYWLVANSWNRTWGMNGYFKFIRGINDCGMEEYITAGLVEPK